MDNERYVLTREPQDVSPSDEEDETMVERHVLVKKKKKKKKKRVVRSKKKKKKKKKKSEGGGVRGYNFTTNQIQMNSINNINLFSNINLIHKPKSSPSSSSSSSSSHASEYYEREREGQGPFVNERVKIIETTVKNPINKKDFEAFRTTTEEFITLTKTEGNRNNRLFDKMETFEDKEVGGKENWEDWEERNKLSNNVLVVVDPSVVEDYLPARVVEEEVEVLVKREEKKKKPKKKKRKRKKLSTRRLKQIRDDRKLAELLSREATYKKNEEFEKAFKMAISGKKAKSIEIEVKNEEPKNTNTQVIIKEEEEEEEDFEAFLRNNNNTTSFVKTKEKKKPLFAKRRKKGKKRGGGKKVDNKMTFVDKNDVKKNPCCVKKTIKVVDQKTLFDSTRRREIYLSLAVFLAVGFLVLFIFLGY